MKVDFWGVRGSIPAPGPDTNRYGGNTSCVSVIDSAGHLCVIDMGTGMVGLGSALMKSALPVDGDFARGQGRATVLLSHAHWDHIQGFPFFAPVFIPGNQFHVIGNAQASERVEAILEGQMNPHFSPIYTLRNLGSSISFEGILEGEKTQVSKMTLTALLLPHGATSTLGFRLTEGTRTVCYLSDVGYGKAGPSDAVIDFCRGADLLIHDATYTPEEQKTRRERGSSTYEDAALVAQEACVRRLALFHYDQDHGDDRVDQTVASCKALLSERGAALDVLGAREGLSLAL